MNYLIYVSTSVKLFEDSDLKEMLQQSHLSNTKVGITGMLLYNKGTFFQVLEGEEEQVNSTFEKIKSDPRHRGIIKMKAGCIEQRNFEDWSMGFTPKTPQSLSGTPGYVNPSNRQFFNKFTSSHPAVSLLKSFTLDNNFSY